MRRKVIKQGNGTLTITLPKDWSQKAGIKAGDEIELEINEKGLLISSEKGSKIQKIQIDVTAMNERAIRLALSAAHKSGFDEIELIYDNPHVITLAYELVKELYMGFSVVEHSSKRIVLKAIAEDKGDDCDTILRRAFIVTLSMADTSLEMIKENKYAELHSLIHLEHFNNQLTNFCERALNKRKYKNGSCFYYVIAWNLEKVCDNYKYICENAPIKTSPKIGGKSGVSFKEMYSKTPKRALPKEIIDFYQKTNEFVREYYNLFYKFDMKHLVELTKQGKLLLGEAKGLSREAKTEFDSLVLTYLTITILQCLDFSASYIVIHDFEGKK